MQRGPARPIALRKRADRARVSTEFEARGRRKMRRALPLTLGTLLLPLPAFLPPCSGSSCAAAHASAAVMSAARAHHSASKSISSGLLLRMVRCARAPSAATTSSKSSDSAVTATVVHSKACAWAREGRGQQSASSRGINTRAPAVQHPRTWPLGRAGEQAPHGIVRPCQGVAGSAACRQRRRGAREQGSTQHPCARLHLHCSRVLRTCAAAPPKAAMAAASRARGRPAARAREAARS